MSRVRGIVAVLVLALLGPLAVAFVAARSSPPVGDAILPVLLVCFVVLAFFGLIFMIAATEPAPRAAHRSRTAPRHSNPGPAASPDPPHPD